MRIRQMTINDYDAIYQLWTDTDGVGLRSLDDSLEGIARFLKRNPTTNFVAELNGQLIGVILSGHDGRRGYIYHTAVKEEHRNNGIGRALVEAVLEALQEEQINKTALVVFAHNDSGNQFWESIGFQARNDLIYRNKSINDENI